MDDNMTLLIDPETRDLVFDENGSFAKVFGNATTIQNVRHALLIWKNEFFSDLTHGTDYDRIFGLNQNDIDDDEIKEIIREAVFQEPDVSRIDSISVTYDKRTVSVVIAATLTNDKTIALEVTT